MGKAHQSAFLCFLGQSKASETNRNDPRAQQLLEGTHQDSFLTQFRGGPLGWISMKNKTCDCISFNRAESRAVMRCLRRGYRENESRENISGLIQAKACLLMNLAVYETSIRRRRGH